MRALLDTDVVLDLLLDRTPFADDAATLHQAHDLPLTDYEDAVQHACATRQQLDAIVTRNLADYHGATINVHTPAAFLLIVQSSK